MEQLVIVLVIAAIGFIKWLMEKSVEQRAKRQIEERQDPLDRGKSAPPILAPRPTAFPIPDPQAASRRLREALGIPDENALPPVRERPIVSPVPTFQIEKIKVAPVADLEQRLFPPAPAAMPKREFQPLPQSPEIAPASPTGLDELLRSHDGLRRAILAQEILGPPKGLVF